MGSVLRSSGAFRGNICSVAPFIPVRPSENGKKNGKMHFSQNPLMARLWNFFGDRGGHGLIRTTFGSSCTFNFVGEASGPLWSSDIRFFLWLLEVYDGSALSGSSDYHSWGLCYWPMISSWCETSVLKQIALFGQVDKYLCWQTDKECRKKQQDKTIYIWLSRDLKR